MLVIKVGGNELDDAQFLEDLAATVGGLSEPAIIVHGGGQAIAQMQKKLGLTPRKVDGLRITDEDSLAVAQMVLSGDINKRIVRALMAHGLQTIGISGVDGSLMRCKKKGFDGVDLGLVGEIVSVNSQLLQMLLDNGLTPVISPISLGLDGKTYNVNADEAAGAIAVALRTKRVWFISNVRAVLDAYHKPIDVMNAAQATELMRQGVIRDGMVPKVKTALNAVQLGVPEAIIANLTGLAEDSGTRFTLATVPKPLSNAFGPEGVKHGNE